MLGWKGCATSGRGTAPPCPANCVAPMVGATRWVARGRGIASPLHGICGLPAGRTSGWPPDRLERPGFDMPEGGAR